MRIFFHDPDNSAQGLYRAKLPALHCYHDLAQRGIELHLSADIQYDETFYPAYIFHRMPSEQVLAFAKQARQNHRRVAWMVDDDLWHFPSHMPHYHAFRDKARLNAMIEEVDFVWVSTSELAKVINRPSKTRILPVLVDPNLFGASPASPADAPLKVLWCGSKFHGKDLDLLVEPVKKLVSDFGGQVLFIFWGYLPEGLGVWYRAEPGSDVAVQRVKPELASSVHYAPGVPLRYYFEKLSTIKPDIGLAPLMDDVFNKSKSNLKYLEYSLAGAAVIASDVEPYKGIKHNETGLRVHENGWYDAIAKLVSNKDLRQNLAANAQEDVSTYYTWTSQARQLWLDALFELVSD